MRVLGIVPARGGSKGVRRKNIRLLCGRPLLAFTAESALAARRLERVVLSTEDLEIARIGQHYGLDVPFLRPAILAQDQTPMIPVVQHAVRSLAETGQHYDAIMLLQPTNPLRQAEDIDGAVGLLEDSGADSVISFVDVGEKHPARMKSVGERGRVLDPPFAEEFEGQRRQELPKLYLREGSIYLTRTETIMNQGSFKGEDCRAWIVPQDRAVNVDEPFDFFLAEQVLRYRSSQSASEDQATPPQSADGRAHRAVSSSECDKQASVFTISPASDDFSATVSDRPTCLGRPHILVAESDGFSPVAERRLRASACVQLSNLDRRGLLKEVGRADVLWIRLRNRIDEEVLTAAKKLKTIVTPTTGLNHIDLTAASARGIEILSLKGETDFLRNVRATAEHTIGMILALLRRLPSAAEHVLNDVWDRDPFRGNELYGKEVGVVGYGRLGHLVAEYLTAFGAHVSACDPNVPKSQLPSWIESKSMLDLLRTSELVTLHVDLNNTTRRLFDRGRLAAMKPRAWLINTSRGEVIDEAALLESLQSGHLAGAALDVLCDEIEINVLDHPLVNYARWHDNLLITPHIGGCSFESMEKTEVFMAEKLVATLEPLTSTATSSNPL